MRLTSPPVGTGNRILTYTVDPNPTVSPRTVNIYVAGRDFKVAQEGVPCTYDVYPPQASFGPPAGTGTVEVTSPSGCDWTAASNDPSWLHVSSGASGNGNGTVSYSVDANASPSGRTGTLTVAGKTFTVNQVGSTCIYNVNPLSISAVSGGGGGSVNVSVQPGCAWTAEALGTGWVTITAGAAGSGDPLLVKKVIARLRASGEIAADDLVYLDRIADRWIGIAGGLRRGAAFVLTT